MFHRIVNLMLVMLVALAGRAAGKSAWETLEGCTWVDHRYNDGDSFRVRQGDREYIFRLYFVDTPERDANFPERVDEQAAYFGVSSDTVLHIGQQAADLVRDQLSRPFTVVTRWQAAQGRSKMPRFYAFIRTEGGQDLNQMLVSQGLARVYGVRAISPDGTAPETVRAALLALEDTARHEKLGAWVTSSQLNVAEARAEALRTGTKVIMTPRTVTTFTPELPRRRMGTIPRDVHVHILDEQSDGFIRIAYDDQGGEHEVLVLRWELGLPDWPMERAEGPSDASTTNGL